jgi:tetratricopeptide (TPR) repeat protein
MSAVRLDRVAAIRATLRDGTVQLGSGYLVTETLVITAAHCVSDKKILSRERRWQSPDRLQIVRASDGTALEVNIADLVVDIDLDVAVIPLPTAWNSGFPPTTFARVNRAEAGRLENCEGIGFPQFARDEAGHRDTAEFHGIVYQTDEAQSGRLLMREPNVAPGTWPSATAQSRIGDVKPDESPWGGLSGALAFYNDHAIGVVVEHHPRQGENAIRMIGFEPIATKSPKISQLLALRPPAQLPQAAAEPSAPPLDVEVPTPKEGGLLGRDDLLDKAVTQLIGGSSVSLLSGIPGAGKTALAVQMTEDARVKQQFRDGRMWLPVGSRKGSGLPHWVHRMATWCRTLNVSADLLGAAQSDEDGPRMAHLVDQALGDRRVLLVFDDVWLPEDAVVFKEIGHNCRRVLTTRIPEVAHIFAQPTLRVPELDRVASEKLLERHCPGARQALGTSIDPVLDTVDGVPLALVLVGMALYHIWNTLGIGAAYDFLAQVAQDDAWLDLSTDEIPAGERPLAGKRATLRRVIDLTAKRLTHKEIEALGALTAFPPKANTFSRPAGQYVAGDSKSFATLASNGLVELFDPTGDRFTMHQAIADYARQAHKGNSAAYLRMAEYYIEYIKDRPRDDWSAWIAALRPEADNLRTALLWTTDVKETRLAMQLMAALWPYWYRTNQFQRARDLAQRVLQLPDPPDATHEDRVLRSQLLNDTGNYAYNMSDLNEAERLHRNALRIREELGEEWLCAGSWNNLSLILRERGDYLGARAMLNRALEINERTRHQHWQLWRAMNFNNLGLTSARLGEYTRARDEQLRAVADFDSLSNDDWGVAMARTDLAEVLVELGTLPEAEGLLRQALPQRAADHDNKAVAAVLRAQAAIELHRVNPENACNLLLAAISLAAPISDRLGEGKALEKLVIAAAKALDTTLAARAQGALMAYQELTGVRTDEATAELCRKSAAEIKRTAGSDVWASAVTEAHDTASRGLVHLIDALGSPVLDVDSNQIVEELLRKSAEAG